jgi:peptidyl-prolyl cis-trans isomerase D
VGETRDVQLVLLPVAGYAAGVTVTDEQVAARYEERKADFQTPETVNLQYVELDLADVAAQVQVTEDGLRAFYDQVAAERYTTAERRRARHILVEAGDDDAAALAKAEKLAAEAKGGADFAALATANSDDPGSKGQGGDLGWATRDSFVAPFADALFAMNQGEIRGPVKTQFGYHIIQLEAIEPGSQRSFEDVRGELEADYRRDQAQAAFYERSQELADEAFAALSELDSVAKKLGLELRTVEGFTRQGGGALGADRKLIDAVFSDEVLVERQNSPALSLGDERVVVVRVTDHKTPQPRPLDEVRGEIEAALRTEAAGQAAAAAARTAAEQLATGADLAQVAQSFNGQPTGLLTISRNAEGLPPELLKAAYATPAPSDGKVSTGTASLADGNAVAFVLRGVKPGAVPPGQESQVGEALRQAGGQQGLIEFSAYVGELERNAKVTRNAKVFDQ